ncbi:MAG TPA: peptide ABC transporter substrate-binding protein [Myxococcales bacterium]|nr:peptide ABC transporter substrate-binding protein [Myxococcales bacterium]
MRRAVLLGSLLAACGPCGFQPDPGVKVVVPAMPSTLDWSTSDPTSWVNYPVMLATMKGLTQLSEKNEIQPGLAERWERSLTPEGHERYLFHLRRDVRWSDGATPVTARDFVVGFRRAAAGKERTETSDLLGVEEVLALLERGAPRAEVDAAVERIGARAVDEWTLEVTLAHPRSYFLARLANVYLFFPAPSADLAGKSEDQVRAYFDRPRDGRPMSVGPFRVESWDRAGERVRLVRNPASAFAPALGPGERPVEVLTLLKSEVGPALYDRGRVGFVFVDSPVALRAADRFPDLTRRELLSTYFLAFNTRRPPLDAPEVRRAIAMALDREALLHGLLPASRPTTVLLPPTMPLSATPEEAMRLPRFDPAAARALLQQRGGVTRTLRLVHTARESFVPETAIAERIRDQLARVGVQVEIDARADFSSEIARIAPDGFRAHDLYLKRLGADYAHPNTFFTLFERTGNHFTGWEQLDGGEPLRRFQALRERADAEPDLETARRLYVQAQEILLGEQVVLAPLYHPDRYFRIQPWLTGLSVDPFNFLSLGEVRLR